ncbi:MAG: ROK family protein [Armatimonadetes bacterium]|nr:ROK family protein [Armatimonadota bacterium]
MTGEPLVLGVDLGGTKSAASLLTLSGETRFRIAVPTQAERGAGAVIATLIFLAQTAQNAAPDPAALIGCGVSAGAPVDALRGIVFPAPNLPGFPPETPLAQILADTTGLLTHLENDADATALAEYRFGAGQGTQTMAFLTVGTGIGAGLIIGGKLHRGAFGAGGEIGHVCVDTSSAARVCNCGLRGCLEAYASGVSVLKIAIENGYSGEPTGVAVANAARSGDRAAQEAFADAADKLGRGLATLAMLLNPERIVLGTLAVHASDLLLAPAIASMRRHAWNRVTENLSVVPAALGDRAQDLAALCAYLAQSGESGAGNPPPPKSGASDKTCFVLRTAPHLPTNETGDTINAVSGVV